MVYTSKDFKEEQIQVFLDSAIERHRIYIRKEVQKMPKPWSDDEVFQDWFFCNLFRRLDKTSKAIEELVIKPNENNPMLWAGILISRWYSYIPSIEVLVEKDCLFTEEGWRRGSIILGERRKEGQKIVTNGFILNTLVDPPRGYAKNVVPFLIVKKLMKYYEDLYGKEEFCPTIDEYFMYVNNLQEAFDLFTHAPATAGFMAYEYVTDLSYSKRYFEEKPSDFYTWCNCTVGSLRGLKRLVGHRPEAKIKVDVYEMTNALLLRMKERAEDEANAMCDVMANEMPLDYQAVVDYLYDISMREVEHWLCEYDKYCRIKYKEKRMKRKYNGRY